MRGSTRIAAAIVLAVFCVSVCTVTERAAEATAQGHFGGWMELDAIFFSERPSLSRVFGPNEAVSVSGNVPTIPVCQSGQGEDPRYQFFPTADLYVIQSSDGKLGDSTKLEDVSGAPNTVIATSGGAFVTETVAITQPSGSVGVGSYDIVMDQCRDGYFTPKDGDFVLGDGPGYAFRIVIHGDEVPNPELTALKDAAAKSALDYGGSDVEGRRGLCWALALAIDMAKLDPRSTLNLSLAGDIGKDACTSLADAYKGVAADPPRSDYDVFAELGPIPRVPGPVTTDLDVAVQRVVNVVAEQNSEIEALLATLERIQGALDDGAHEFLTLQLRHADELAYLLRGPGGSLLRSYAAFEILDAAVAQSGADPTTIDDVRGAITAARYGTAGLVDPLGPRFHRPDLNTLVPVGLQAWVFALTTTDPAYLTSGITSIPVFRQASGLPPIVFRHPVARTSGPYTVPPGRSIAFDATSSSDPNGDALDYAWDLDGDGFFDDGASPVTTAVFSEAGTRLVGVKVVDSSGREDVGYTLLRVGDTSRQDMIVVRHGPRQVMRIEPDGTANLLREFEPDPILSAYTAAVQVEPNGDFYLLSNPGGILHLDSQGLELRRITMVEIADLLGIQLTGLSDFVLDGRGDLIIVAEEPDSESWPYDEHILIRLSSNWTAADTIVRGLNETRWADPSIALDPEGNILVANLADPSIGDWTASKGVGGVYSFDPDVGTVHEVIPASNTRLEDGTYRSTDIEMAGTRVMGGASIGVFGFDVDPAGNLVVADQYNVSRIGTPALLVSETAYGSMWVHIEGFWAYGASPAGGYSIGDVHDPAVDAAGDYVLLGWDSENRWVVFRATTEAEFFKVADLGSPLEFPAYGTASGPSAIGMVPEVRKVTPRDVVSSPVVRLDELAVAQDSCPGSATLSATVRNVGSATIESPVTVFFHNGDPRSGGEVVGVAETDGSMSPGGSIAVSIDWADPEPGAHEIYASAPGANIPSAVFMVCIPRPPEIPFTLMPEEAELPVGATHQLHIFVPDIYSMPMVGVDVTFDVTGANPGSQTVATDEGGVARFSYTGLSAGQDVVVARVSGTESNEVKVQWQAVNSPPNADASGPYTVDEGSVVTLDGSGSSDPDGDVLVLYEWDFDNDGTYDAGGTAAAITHVFDDGPGMHTVGLRVVDSFGASGTDAAEVIVENVAPTATFLDDGPADEGMIFALNLAAPHDPSGADTAAGFTYAFDCGDGAGYGPFDGVPDVMCVTTDDGTRIVRSQIVDKDGGLTEYTGTAMVLNVAPAVGPISLVSALLSVGTAANASAEFTDPGTADTHTAVWDWGDGTTPGTVTEIDGSGSVDDSHTYSAAGVYTVELTVTDDDGGAAVAMFQYVNVYDPSHGFVTGGGWIDSPEGAYKPDPSLTGKATFGFVSKYKKGTSFPTGNAEFQFHAGDLNFHSTSYDWLVVTGSNFAKFKGVGAINGEGAYKFQIWAGDNDPDTFRIKIWNDSGTVYDNGMNQPIGGGSIIVHTAKK